MAPAVSRKRTATSSASDAPALGVVHRVVQHRGDDPGGAVGRRRHDAPTRRVLLVDGERHQVHPILGEARITVRILLAEALMPLPRAPAHLQRAGQQPGAADAALLAFHHDVTQMKQLRSHLLETAHAALVGEHHLADRTAGARSEREQFCGRRERRVVLVGDDGVGGSLALGDDESAPDRRSRSRRCSVRSSAPYAVSVMPLGWKSSTVRVYSAMSSSDEGDGYSPAEHYLAGVAQSLLSGFHLLGSRWFPGGTPRVRAGPRAACRGRGRSPRATRTAPPGHRQPGRVHPMASRSATKFAAARIGPTVCELDGPMPTLKSSKTLMVTESPPLATAAGRADNARPAR